MDPTRTDTHLVNPAVVLQMRKNRKMDVGRQGTWTSSQPTAAGACVSFTTSLVKHLVKQYKYIISHFRRPDVRLRSYWAKVKILAGLAPSESLRGECFLPFPASRGSLHSVSRVNSLLPCNLKYSLWVLGITAFIPLGLLPPPHSLHGGENTTVPKAQIRISRPPRD